MPARALLVLLVMLNLGVALWWLLRPAPPTPPAQAQPAGVPRLQLLEERAAAPVPPAAPTPAPEVPVDADGDGGAEDGGVHGGAGAVPAGPDAGDAANGSPAENAAADAPR